MNFSCGKMTLQSKVLVILYDITQVPAPKDISTLSYKLLPFFLLGGNTFFIQEKKLPYAVN